MKKDKVLVATCHLRKNGEYQLTTYAAMNTRTMCGYVGSKHTRRYKVGFKWDPVDDVIDVIHLSVDGNTSPWRSYYLAVSMRNFRVELGKQYKQYIANILEENHTEEIL